MKKNILLFGLITFAVFVSCENDEDDFPRAASLKVVHAASGAPPLHVDYFGFEEPITFSTNPSISFGSNVRYTLPAGESRNIEFVNSLDTTVTVLSREVNLPEGNISTIYLTGDDTDVEALLVEDNVLNALRDSIVGVRFANLSLDSGLMSVVNVGNTDEEIIGNLDYQDFSDYLEFPAKSTDGSYNFEFRDTNGNVLASFTFDPLQRRNVSVRRNLTLALIGLLDDGTGESNLAVARVNNY